jgi:uncharacterized protein (TIGR00730 family)
MNKAVCVFSASSDNIALKFFEVAAELGARLGQHGYDLVYGGGKIGLMGELARAAQANGGKVIGVIPERFREHDLALEGADEMIVTKDMRERKTIMEARADVFVGLPGGFGTLEEILEILTLKQLHYHAKPIVLINTNNFYDHLVNLFEHIYEQQFARQEHRDLYHVAKDVNDAFSYIDNYKAASHPAPWY